MRFTTAQRFASPVDAVAAAYADPGLYPTLSGLTKLGQPEVLGHEEGDGRVTLRIRYRFGGELSSAARAVLDPARLTWIEVSEHDLAARTTTFRMLPDHYADRFTCTGRYRFLPADDGGCTRAGEGDLRVRAPLVGGAVERAIVSGLHEHLAEEAPLVDRYVSGEA